MSDNLVATEGNRLLAGSLGVSAYTAPTGPMKLALTTTAGTRTAAGVEVTGGSYARQPIVFSAPANLSSANTATITYTALPACTVVGIEVFDSAGTPRRSWTGRLVTAKQIPAGDTISFAPAAVSVAFN